MAVRASRQRNVLKNSQVDVAVPRIHGSESLGNPSTVGAEVVILLDEGVQSRPLIGRRNSLASGGKRIEQDIALVARNVDEIIPRLTVSVHVTRVNERVPIPSGTGESIPLGDLGEQSELCTQRGRPRIGIGCRSDEPVTLAELGIAALRPVWIAARGLRSPQHAGNLR